MKRSVTTTLRLTLTVVLGLAATVDSSAQPAFLVKKINPFGGAVAQQLQSANGTLFFNASDGATTGAELWKSDGTDAGTVLVKDINPGSAGSDPRNLVEVNGTLFFVAAEPTHGIELWKSDGTAAGTVVVKDIVAGPGSSNPENLLGVNGMLFFRADDGASGLELWKSDGTANGTTLVKDIVAGGSSFVSELTDFNGRLLFVADYTDLWASDGTAEGTIQLTRIRNSAPGYQSFPLRDLERVGSTLFFTALGNAELWKSDGTSAGTVLVKQIFAKVLTNVSGTLFFSGRDASGSELWKSDGTSGGTVLVKDIYPAGSGLDPGGLTAVGATVFFSGDDGSRGRELWKSDGSEAGTVLVRDISPGSADPTVLTSIQGTLLFWADDAVNGRELWTSDGTPMGTSLVQDITPGPAGSEPTTLGCCPILNRVGEFELAGSMLFFNVGAGRDLWALGETFLPPFASIDDRSVSEGSATSAGFRITLSAASSSTVTMTYATGDGTATAPGDYASTTGTVTFGPGRTEHSMYVPIVTDAAAEGSETFYVYLTGVSPAGQVGIGDGEARGTIEDPPTPTHVPMYRAYSRQTDYHFFTTDLASKNFAVSVLGYQDESNPIPFYVWNALQSDTTPLFRMYNPNLGRHYYTAGSGDRDFLIAVGMVYEKDEGFIYPVAGTSGTTELYRLYNNNSGTHLFTADAAQKDGILALFPGVWEQHTSVGYVFPPSNDPVVIDILGDRGASSYSPPSPTLTVGQRVAWRNADFTAHTATADAGAFDTTTIAPGATTSPITMETPGSFPYHCSIHPGMMGTITVIP